MAHALSFSEDFFLPDDPEAIAPGDRPTLVYQAIISESAGFREEIARLILGRDNGRVDPLEILAMVRMADTCENLDSPVRVWIDRDGGYTLDVYDFPIDGG